MRNKIGPMMWASPNGRENFCHWWWAVGSGIRENHEEPDQYLRRVAEHAWHAGRYQGELLHNPGAKPCAEGSTPCA